MWSTFYVVYAANCVVTAQNRGIRPPTADEVWKPFFYVVSFLHFPPDQQLLVLDKSLPVIVLHV